MFSRQGQKAGSRPRKRKKKKKKNPLKAEGQEQDTQETGIWLAAERG